MEEKIIARGAEAIIKRISFFGLPAIAKQRVKKSYRQESIDSSLRKTRTKAEAYILHSAKQAGVRCPVVYSASETELVVSDVKGELLHDLLKQKGAGKAVEEVGKNLARLHSADMVHGDFTTSNVIVDGKKVWLIDFGLGGFATDLEEKAIDVLLMERSLGDEKLFKAFTKGYSEYKNAGRVLKQMSEITKRGRYVKSRKEK